MSANPLSNETAIYDRLKKNLKKVKDPALKEILDDCWELIDHHIGNSVYKMQLNLGSHVTGDKPEDVPFEHGKRLLVNCDDIRTFLIKLKDVTKNRKD